MQLTRPERNRISWCVGFTLIELIITLALAAILLTLGISGFQQMVQSNRTVTAINGFIGALNLARSEAMKRSIRVTLCKSADRLNCSISGGYEQGWIIFVDNNNNATVDHDEAIIQISDPVLPGAGVTLTGNQPVAKYISYSATGNTQLISGAFQAGTVRVCAAGKGYQVVINPTGRVRTEEGIC